MKCIGIIPARYASTRFPGKPLVDIGGKTMIRRVYEQASTCTALAEVLVATDHQEIFDHVKTFGQVVMTSSDHQNGTSRCLEAIEAVSKGRYSGKDVVINIQGDEPFVHPLQIELVVGIFANEKAQIGSLMKSICSAEELFDENAVKVITDANKKAIYFSRAPIPHYRDLPANEWLKNGIWYKHIGIYGYRIESLQTICHLPEGLLEKAEKLEQLRWIEHGIPIYMNITGMQHTAIDTPEDLGRLLHEKKRFLQ